MNQLLCIRVLRVFQHLVGQAGFDDAGLFHHHHPVGDRKHLFEPVGDGDDADDVDDFSAVDDVYDVAEAGETDDV